MKYIQLCFFIPIFGLFTACAQMSVAPGGVEQQVDLWLQQQQYDKALNTLAKVFPKHPEPARIERLHKEVSSKAQAYEGETVLQANKLIIQEQWSDALILYERAIKNYSKGTALKEGLDKLHDIQAERTEELGIDILIAHAEWLENSLVMYTAIAKTSPQNRSAQRALKKKRKELEKVSTQLTERGVNALKQNDIQTAERLIPMAMRLVPNARSERAYKALRKISKKNVKTTKKKSTYQALQTKVKKSSAKELLNNFDEAYRKKNLAKAQQILSQLEDIKESIPKFGELRRRLDHDIPIAIDREMSMGISQYSRGEPEQAIVSWQKVLRLDPDNSLAQAHIQRANRILGKLKQLRKKQ